MVVYVDNPRSAYAAYALYEQLGRIDPSAAGNSAETFYAGLISNIVPGYKAHHIQEGKHKGKLTLATLVRGKWKPDPRIKPVDFVNIAPFTAIKRLEKRLEDSLK